VIDEKTRKALVADLRLIPDLVGRTLEREAEVEKAAHALKDIATACTWGADQYADAYEGALKLKKSPTSMRKVTRRAR